MSRIDEHSGDGKTSIIAYLKKPLIVKEQIEKTQKELRYVNTELSGLPSSGDLSGVNVQTSPSQEAVFASLIAKKEELETSLSNLEEKLAAMLKKRIDFINRNTSGIENSILFSRYILDNSWQDIGRSLGYTERHTRRLHNEALEKLLQRLKNQTQAV